MASRFLTRRRLLAASGATLAASGPFALAACGDTSEEDEETSPAREAELLRLILAEHTAVQVAADDAVEAAPEELTPVVKRLQGDIGRQIADLAAREAELTEEGPAEPAARAGEAESAVEGLKLQLEQALTVTIEAIGELPPAPRTSTQRVLVADAAALAAIRATLGEEIAPDAFAMGPPAKAAA